jgi:S1-C subfamily serine protease
MLAALAILAGNGTFTRSTITAASPRAATGPVRNPNNGLPAGPGAAPPDGRSPAFDIRAALRAVEPGVVNITNFSAGNNGASQATGAGTGMVIDAQGDVLTNNHVISGASTVAVQVLGQSTIHQAKVLGADTVDDVAVIRMQDPGPLSPVPLGHSSGVQVGDPVIAIGNALALAPGGPTITSGIISAINRSLTRGSEHLTGLLQTDAAISAGDSGGPLVDAKGQVIAMTTAVSTDGQNVGFAIPIDRIAPLVDSLKNGVTPPSPQGYLGVGMQPSTSGPGAQVTSVAAGSPAATAGLQVGDVITAINGQKVLSSRDAADAIASNAAGSKVTIEFQRGGASQNATATLAPRIVSTPSG